MPKPVDNPSNRGCISDTEMQQMFNRYDKDGSGNLDQNEFNQYMTSSMMSSGLSTGSGGGGVFSEAMFDNADTNNDNTLDFDEFAEFHRNAAGLGECLASNSADQLDPAQRQDMADALRDKLRKNGIGECEVDNYMERNGLAAEGDCKGELEITDKGMEKLANLNTNQAPLVAR